jgi:hypothetical protein
MDHHHNCCGCCRVIEIKLDAILQLLIAIQTGKPVDLNIVFGLTPPKTRENVMANKKGSGPAKKCPCLKPKSGGKGAVMVPITLTDVPASINLQPIDASGNPVTISPSDTVTGTLTSDSASFVIAPGVDTLNYTATIPANTPQGTIANLSATAKGTIQGAAADLTASVQLTLNIPPSPVAVDLQIILG